ncbi:MAG: ATP-dependent RecD-like DNA helicase [Clostridia bacterium]|nr:ATP-dependent RecD-like DNA helicase [Clostridia bacterium]
MLDRMNESECSGLDKLEGCIEGVIYSNEENGYSICDLSLSEDGEIVTIVGTMPMLHEGDHLCVYGKWTHNPKYGRQFAVQQYERVMPADRASILRYLASRAIKGIGPKTAERIVEEFGEDSFDVIENHPEWLANIKGISMKTALAASESFRNQAGIRSAMLFFREYFGAAITMRIYQKWGSSSVDRAKANPYCLCNEIEGIGFERADLLAERIGFDRMGIERIMSGVQYVLSQNGIQNGHVCLPKDKLRDSAALLLSVEPEQVEQAISELLRQRNLNVTNADGQPMIYLAEHYRAETYIAEKLVLLNRMCAAIDLRDIDRFIEGEERKSGMQYAALQKQAISDALRYGVMLLTGGPGTGKTTVVRALLHIFDSMGYEIALAAPTGRAAKRLSETTSTEAKTIHRLLEMVYDGNGRMVFNRNEMDLLEEQIIIVDEASMIDNGLMCALLKAIKPGARLIMIGDSDQLPSVGAGNVLRDLLDSGRLATVCLTEIFRQARESLIVTNAHAINRGEMPELSVKNNDFFFLPRNTDREIAATVADLCQVRLPRTYGELAVNGTQVVAASRKGEAGTEHLNLLLQQRLNPPQVQKREYEFRDRRFREGDRVMQTRNNYDLAWVRSDGTEGNGIFNGDIGVIQRISPSEGCMEICFDDRTVLYELTALEDLEHAYAITVHKSQGSEYPIVVIPVGSAAQMLLTRNLLYTAVTRAQSMVILVGRKEIVETMVQNDRQSMRYTGLAERLREKRV